MKGVSLYYKQGDNSTTNKKHKTMKTYIVKTQTSVNEHLLHSLMQKVYTTNDLADARKVFEAEVEQLKNELKTIDQLGYEPSQNEQNHAVYASIIAIDDEDADEVEFVEDSEYFYE